ncbi:hypothetical protein GCM10009736_43410 [Actinomadura bangladeshensis]|nr:hypothetical protein [Actinomadura bangladeshensis]
MACRVDEDAESAAARLVLREFGAGAQDAFLRRVQVVDAEVVVDPARRGRVGPSGRRRVADALKAEPDVALDRQGREVVVAGTEVAPGWWDRGQSMVTANSIRGEAFEGR